MTEIDASPNDLGSGPTQSEQVSNNQTRPLRFRIVEVILGKFGIVIVLAVLMVTGQILYSSFLTLGNVSNVISQNASVGIVAIGMTYVIIGQGFDLSVGGIYALSSVLYPGVAANHSVLLGAAAALGAGLAAGLINAAVVARVKVNPFVATPISVSKPGFQWLGAQSMLGVPVAIWTLVVVTLIGAFVLTLTAYGRNIFAIGGNPEASRLAGVRVGLVRGSTYVITGVLAALGGIMITSQIGVGQANVGGNLALDSIAMVIIGGTSLSGGEGAVWRTIIGFLVLSGVTNLLQSLGIGSSWQSVATGAILVGAVSIDVISGRLSIGGIMRR
jgi:ribose transport system permease protein